MILKEFLIQLGFKINEAGLSKFNDGVASASAKVGLLAGAVSAASLAVFAGVNSMAKKLDELSDVAGRIGVTVDEIDKLGFAAALNDSSIEAVTQSLEGLAQVAGLAANGLGRGAKVFQKLGINVKDGNGKLKNTADLMREVGEAIKPLEKGEQTALLSRLGIDKTLAATLTSDLSTLFAEYERINKAAGFIPDEAAKEASNYEDALNKLKHVFDVIGKTVASKFFKKFTEGFKNLTETLIQNMPRIIPAVTAVANAILTAGSIVVDVLQAIFNVVARVIGWFSSLNEASGGLAGKILLVAAAWKFLNLSFLASPIGMVVALGAAIALLIDDFLGFKEGANSLIDWSLWEPGITAATQAIQSFGALIVSVFDVAFGVIDFFVKLINGDFAGAWDSLTAIFNSVISVATNLWGILKGIGEALGNFAGASVAVAQGAPVLTPSPQAAASIGTAQQGGNTVNAKTEIIVNGAGDPKAVGTAVAGMQKSVNSDTVRNFSGAAR